MSFVLYLVGAAIAIGGVAWAMVALHVPQQWVLISVVILLGLGIFSGVAKTRTKDPP
ncbi:MAG: hypothetical protein ABI120_01410 [Gemmatimonadaceae bacterium]